MSTHANTIDHDAYMTNSKGHLVSVEHVKAEDKLEDQLVETLIFEAQRFHSEIKTFKSHAFSEVRTFMQLLAEKYSVQRGGEKGGITLSSFDGTKKVVIAVQDYIAFGPQLQIAKNLIDQCIKGWGAQTTNNNIQALVEHAFRVDKNNRVNTQNILGLRRLNIQDATWQKAMEAIDDSIKVVASKEYIRFYTRPRPDAEWEAVTVDIAKV